MATAAHVAPSNRQTLALGGIRNAFSLRDPSDFWTPIGQDVDEPWTDESVDPEVEYDLKHTFATLETDTGEYLPQHGICLSHERVAAVAVVSAKMERTFSGRNAGQLHLQKRLDAAMRLRVLNYLQGYDTLYPPGIDSSLRSRIRGGFWHLILDENGCLSIGGTTYYMNPGRRMVYSESDTTAEEDRITVPAAFVDALNYCADNGKTLREGLLKVLTYRKSGKFIRKHPISWPTAW